MRLSFGGRKAGVVSLGRVKRVVKVAVSLFVMARGKSTSSEVRIGEGQGSGRFMFTSTILVQ